MNLHFIVEGKGLTLHYLCVVGSVAHGLKCKNSDLDLKGVFTWDLSVVSSINKIQDSLEISNVSEEAWNIFLEELKDRLELTVDIDDDITFMDARKFIVTAKKNELNLLDMLYSKKVLYISSLFQKTVLDNLMPIISFEYARSRFKGLSNGSLKYYHSYIKRYSENNLIADKRKAYKELARSVHVLYILEQYLKDYNYASLLKNKTRLKYIKDIRAFKYSVEEVVIEKDRMFKRIEKLVLDQREVDIDKCNQMVVDLNLSEIHNILQRD